MHLNIHATTAVTAVNDNNSTWIDHNEINLSNIDLTDYVLHFTPELSAHLGLHTTAISFAYFEYLLNGYVADEHEQASQRLIALMNIWAGPGWR